MPQNPNFGSVVFVCVFAFSPPDFFTLVPQPCSEFSLQRSPNIVLKSLFACVTRQGPWCLGSRQISGAGVLKGIGFRVNLKRVPILDLKTLSKP